MLEDWIKPFTLELSSVVEGFAAVIIGFAVIEAATRLLLGVVAYLHRHPEIAHQAKDEVRLRLGRWLSLALELLLAADILRTAVAPSWSEIGKLAAIAAIRTALNFFLHREIESERRAELAAATPRHS